MMVGQTMSELVQRAYDIISREHHPHYTQGCCRKCLFIGDAKEALKKGE